MISDYNKNIQKHFMQPEDIILDNFQKGILSDTEVCKCFDLLEKAISTGYSFGKKEATVGEVRERAAGKFEKTVYGWKPVTKDAPHYKKEEQKKPVEEKKDDNGYIEKIKSLKGIDGIEEIYAMFKKTGKLTDAMKKKIDELWAEKQKDKKDDASEEND